MFPQLAPPADPAKQAEEEAKFTPSAPDNPTPTPSSFKGADFSAFKKGTPQTDEKYFPELKKK